MQIKNRLRRLRKSNDLRNMLSETHLRANQLAAPLFIRPGKNIIEPVESMPGVSRYSTDTIGKYVSGLADLGIKAVLLFGIPEHKDSFGSGAYSKNGVIPSAIKSIKDAVPSMMIISDVCLCEYTNHGHCGILAGKEVDNDKTLVYLKKAAVQYARAGADMVAPSAMMDGQVGALRKALDKEGYKDTLVMGYSAKYASAFYGPFRNAAESAPSFGDRKTYQMNPANSREAMREIEMDVKEGADIIMVKPALAYLDVISEARKRFDMPLAAYNVSGEYAMVKAAGLNKWIDPAAAALEVVVAIKRAGADIIITYHAEELASMLNAK